MPKLDKISTCFQQQQLTDNVENPETKEEAAHAYLVPLREAASKPLLDDHETVANNHINDDNV